ncbi:MAG: nucleotide exchange factor GrpE [Patescibacteria group bacterium]
MDENEQNSVEEETIELDEEVVEDEGAKDRLKKTRREPEACRKEKEEYLAGWQRAKADMINARKDEEKAREVVVKFAEERLLEALFPLADSLEQAIKAGGGKGFENIYKQLRSIFASHGVTQVESLGRKFDPARHEALMLEEVDEEEKDDEIVEELSPGYEMHGRVLRPARVKVGHYQKKV